MTADAAIAALTEGAELRTWSLIVTIFGDMAREPGAEIPGPVLSALAGRMGVKPEAVRVALHRLRKDGWISARRTGRLSHYGLTSAGREESERATRRIYATAPPDPEIWHVAIAGPLDAPARLALDGTLSAAGYVSLAPGAWLGPGPAPNTPETQLFYLEGTPLALPGWLRDTLMPPALAEAYSAFAASLERVDAALDRAPTALDPLDRAAIRVLLVHRWRRLVLRHPALPDAFFPATWPGPRLRARLHGRLDRLGQPAVAEIAARIDTAA